MSIVHRSAVAVFAAVVATGCAAAPPQQAATRDLAALDAVTSAIIGMPITTASADARTEFLAGQRELDLARNFEALDHFKRAVQADSTFAIAWLNLANTSNTLDEFKTDLARAETLAGRASESEQLQIQMARKGLENDVSGQLALAQQLVVKYPQSARAYLLLGGIQTGLNRNAEARAAYAKALALAPRMLAAHVNQGNSLMLNEPKDFNGALAQFKEAEALAPNEPAMHDVLGDAYRALNDLPQARAEYTRGHVLNPRDAGMLQQRGHVNSFSGDYAAARADYDSAMAIGRGNERGFFAPFRAYVSVYAGDPGAAIAELNQLAAGAEKLGVPDPTTVKINALSNVALIAIHIGNGPDARAALTQREPLMLKQADQVGSAGFRRAQQQNIAYFNAWLAARSGDYAAASREIDALTALVTPDANPRKLEPVHQLKGFMALYQGKFADAAMHLAQANLQDPYVQYNYAIALERSGKSDQAQPMYRALATYNFNALGYALIRKEARQKAATS